MSLMRMFGVHRTRDDLLDEVARKAVLERRMAKWELWQVVSGMDIDDGANFLYQ